MENEFKDKKANSSSKKTINIELAVFIGLILLNIIVHNVLKNNKLALMELPRAILFLAPSILFCVVIIQILRSTCKRVKRPIIKFIIRIIAIIPIFIYLSISLMVSIIIVQNEHVVEKDNKKMVASVKSFLRTDVYYYDYINPFVRGNKIRICEYYCDSTNDPFSSDGRAKLTETEYYDDNGDRIK